MRLLFKEWMKPGMRSPDSRASFGPLVYIVKQRPGHGWFARYPTTTSLSDHGPFRQTPSEAEADCEAHLQAIADALDQAKGGAA